MVTLINVKFLTSYDCSLANSVFKGMFSQQIFFKQQLSSIELYFCCFFFVVVCLFFLIPCKTCEIFCHFLQFYQKSGANIILSAGPLFLLCLFLLLSGTIDVMLLDISDIIQFWSMPAGCDELAREFEAIRNILNEE